jgi:NADPH:quinone reductase-like Zn-dependent oxidoreductase
VRVEEVATPAPRADEVLIRVHAAPVATADCEVRTFAFPAWSWLPLRLMFGVFRPRPPIQILGQELAGEITAVGVDVTAFKPGDQVMAAIEGFGAHAEYKCLPASAAIALKPSNTSYAEASTLSVFALNALHFVGKAALQRGQRILINGAGSSIGTPAVQLAKLAGAEVTAVDSAAKLDMLRDLGADHVIDFRREDFTRNGVRYDVILDVIGKSPYGRSLRSLTPRGRYILANPKALHMLRSLWTNGAGSKRVFFAMASARSADLVRLREFVDAGKLNAVIDRTFTLEEAADAHRYVASGEKRGNVVLLMR